MEFSIENLIGDQTDIFGVDDKQQEKMNELVKIELPRRFHGMVAALRNFLIFKNENIDRIR